MKTETNNLELVQSKEHGISLVLTHFTCGTVGLQSIETGKKFCRMEMEISDKKTF